MGWGQNIFLGDLKNLGWKLATGFGCENYVYLKPGVKKSTGTVGVDMFNGESALEAYINENGYELSDDDDDDDTSSVVSADAEGRGGDDDGNNGGASRFQGGNGGCKVWRHNKWGNDVGPGRTVNAADGRFRDCGDGATNIGVDIATWTNGQTAAAPEPPAGSTLSRPATAEIAAALGCSWVPCD